MCRLTSYCISFSSWTASMSFIGYLSPVSFYLNAWKMWLMIIIIGSVWSKWRNILNLQIDIRVRSLVLYTRCIFLNLIWEFMFLSFIMFGYVIIECFNSSLIYWSISSTWITSLIYWWYLSIEYSILFWINSPFNWGNCLKLIGMLLRFRVWCEINSSFEILLIIMIPSFVLKIFN